MGYLRFEASIEKHGIGQWSQMIVGKIDDTQPGDFGEQLRRHIEQVVVG